MDSFGNAMEVTRIGVTRPAALLVPLRAFPTAALTLTPRASAAMIQAVGRGIGQSLDLIARLHAVLAAALALAARPVGGVIRAIGRGIGHSADLIARLRAVLGAALTLTPRASAAVIQAIGRGITRSVAWIARLAIPLKTSVRAAGVVLVLAFVLSTLQWTPGPRPHVRSTAAPGPRVEPTQIVSFLPLPPVAPSVEPNRVVPAAPQIDGPRQSPSRTSVSAKPRVPARAAARETPALPAPVPERVAPVTHVVGRLAAKDRTAAERDFTALLAGVGGSELGRQHRGAFTAVEVVVPQSRYNDFARGLTRLGSWQLEAARSPLPDAVHMTIRVSEK